MAKKTASLILFIAAAALVFTMFIFSSQDGNNSSELSRDVSRFLAENANPSYWKLCGTTIRENILDFMSLPVRKAAHFAEFALLGALLMCGFMCLRFPMPLRALYSFLICAAAAAADEYHQSFVSGRAGMFTDVLLDALGGLSGILFVAVLCMAGLYLIGHTRLKKGARKPRSPEKKKNQYHAAPPPDGTGTEFRA
ncbi:MAG: VanZ family protein [Clostridia bacterium]|nr:VanZ family protein [Clostridia bacterium]